MIEHHPIRRVLGSGHTDGEIMFNNSDKEIDVSIRMLDQAVIWGTIQKGQSATLENILSKDGQRKFIAKHQIAYVEPVEPLRKPTLKTPGGRFTDAFAMLGVPRTCTLEEAKTAYHAKAKLYHPDVFSGYTLPEEVSTYVNDMFRQINTAFTEIRSELANAA